MKKKEVIQLVDIIKEKLTKDELIKLQEALYGNQFFDEITERAFKIAPELFEFKPWEKID